jgi:NitT/TauT family transport system substrate-binding protein
MAAHGAYAQLRGKLFALLTGMGCMLAWSQPGLSEETKDYGKPGSPIDLVVGYQPYYTESWSGVIMRNKKFYEKYLPQGSKVDFQVGLQGAIIVNGMLAGKVDLGYVGDMPGIVSTSHADVRDIRIVSVLGLGFDQCNAFLVRTDAPQFQSSDEAIKWLNGKTVAVPKGSCTDRFAQAVFKRFKIAPSEYLNQSIEVITSGFRAKKLDAAVMWEPTTSRLVLDKLARKVATGASVNENDGGFMVMPKALIEQRPDVVNAWLEAELDSQLYFADPNNAMSVSAMALEQTTGFPQKTLWYSAYGSYPAAEGGTTSRIVLTYGFTPEAKDLIAKAAKFLLEIKSIKADIRPEAVMPSFTEDILKKRNLKSPIGEVKALPDSAYTGS